MRFDLLALATSLITFVLGMGWLFKGTLLLKRWAIEPNAVGLLIGRRIGVIYLSLSLIFFLARSAPPSDARSALSAGALVACTLLAALGWFEFKARRVGPGILVSVTAELMLSAGFASFLLA